jgi:hypothetical protein
VLGAVAGLWLAWLLYDWLGDPSDHCDYPEECLGSWFGRSFMLVQTVWILGVGAAGVGAVAAARARWPRRDVALLAVSCAVLFASLVTTPMHWGGQVMTADEIEGNWYLWGSHGAGYERLGLLVAVISLVLGWRAASGHPRRAPDRCGGAGLHKVAHGEAAREAPS